MERKVLVVGSGGREHALGWALARSPRTRVEAAPGNPGLAALGRVHAVAATDGDGIERLVTERAYDLVVIGPEDPLAGGLADRLRARGTAVFGPGAEGAQLEASKAFAKEFMARHRIPTARHRVVSDPREGRKVLEEWGAPVVVKASGLAAGKGVTVAATREEAEEALTACLRENRLGAAGSTVVLEECLEGEEASMFVITDGRRYRVLPTSRDHKRAFDGDRGPNTGGMGAVSPAPILTAEREAEVEEEMIARTLDGLRADGIEYRGVLYLGLMITQEGPRLLEYNVRFGDPETQAVLPRLGFDLASLLEATARGELGDEPLPPPAEKASACVVAATADYPARGERGLPIHGIEKAERAGALVFHAGTAREGGELRTAGGRILNLVGVGETVDAALARAYDGIAAVSFPGMRFRRDIGRGSDRGDRA